MLPLAQARRRRLPAACSTNIALIDGLQDVLGAGVTSFGAGNIILGGDGSDIIEGRGGDDLIDGDAWLNVRISVCANAPTAPDQSRCHNMDDRRSRSLMFDGTYNPGQLVDRARDQPARRLATSTPPCFRELAANMPSPRLPTVKSSSATRSRRARRQRSLRDIEKIQFANGNALNIVVGTPSNDVSQRHLPPGRLVLGLDGADTLNGGGGNDILVGGPMALHARYSSTISRTSATPTPTARWSLRRVG